MQARVLGDARQINIWLPPNYRDEVVRYPVLYVLDGALDQDFIHVAGLGQLGALSATYETFIIVGVQTRARRHELTARPSDLRYAHAFPEAGGADDFRRFLAEEVIPFIDGRFRTTGRRTLMGESLAGLFVVDTLLHAPRSFDDFIAISPSVWWDDRALAKAAPALLALDGFSGRRLYIAFGNEGGTMQRAIGELRSALEHQNTLQWTLRDRTLSEIHETIYHGAALDALRTFYALPPYEHGPPYELGPLPWFLTEGESPPPN
ncbi:MAG: alpha/beta hydrolase-fold protein [Terricaulis sp.]